VARPPAPLAGLSVVLLGHFNPPIFHPAWFAEQGLLSKADARSATVQVIQAPVAAFRTDDLSVVVTQAQFNASTTTELFHETLRDLVIGTFQALRHTPVWAIGLNTDTHFKATSENAWEEFSRQLVLLSDWATVLEEPSALTVTIRGKRPDDRVGSVNVKIEPSVIVKPGIYVQTNDHVERPIDEGRNASLALDVLGQNWEPAMARANRVLDYVGAMVK
jgi:hypothetical protein